MRTVLAVSLVSIVAAVGPAMAADLTPPPVAPVYKAPPPVPSWTGCYVGGGGGYGVFTANQHFETFPGLVGVTQPQDNGGEGWMGLVGGGCDYEFQLLNWNVVVGAFGDYDFLDYRGTIGIGVPTGDLTESSAWAGGLRVGILAAPNVLIYTNGGYTGTHLISVNFTTIAGTPSTLPSQNLSGYFLGGGVESSLSWIVPGLFLRTEYRYSSYQAKDGQLFATATGAPTAFAFNTNLSSQAVFTQLVYRFNWSGGWH